MLEISTSGLMSGDGKRSGVFRAQSPRPSSTLPLAAIAANMAKLPDLWCLKGTVSSGGIAGANPALKPSINHDLDCATPSKSSIAAIIANTMTINHPMTSNVSAMSPMITE